MERDSNYGHSEEGRVDFGEQMSSMQRQGRILRSHSFFIVLRQFFYDNWSSCRLEWCGC